MQANVTAMADARLSQSLPIQREPEITEYIVLPCLSCERQGSAF